MNAQELISLVANLFTIIAGVITIYSLYKSSEGNNIVYLTQNNNPIIIFSSQNPVQKTVQKSSKLTDDPRVAGVIGVIILATLLFFYSYTYELIPAFLLFLFSVFLLNDIKLSFKNKTAQTQWFIKRVLTIISIIVLFFTPKSILDIIEQLPALHINSSEEFISSFSEMFRLIYILSKDSTINFLNIVFRIIATFGILFFIIESFKNNEKIHNVQKLPDFIRMIFSIMMIVVFSNFEFYWNIIEPLRIAVINWFIPPQ